MSRTAVRVLRIALYTVIFLSFVVLFIYFGDISVEGKEYFSPRNSVLVTVLLFVLLGLTIVIGIILAVMKKPSPHHRLKEVKEILQ